MANIRDLWTRPDGDRRVRTARYGTGKRWAVEWREGRGTPRSRSFTTKEAARSFKTELEGGLASGSYITRSRSDATVGDVWEQWIASKRRLKPTTLHAYRSTWRAQIEPRWGAVPLAGVRRGDVHAWLPGLDKPRRNSDPRGERVPLSSSQIRHCAVILKAILDYAVDDGRLAANPLTGLRLPVARSGERVPLTGEQLAALISASPDAATEIRLMVQTGIRWGEMVALRVSDVDAKRRRLRVHRGYVEVDGQRIVQEVKSGRGREVPLSGPMLRELRDLSKGRAGGEPLLPGPRGDGWTRTMWDRRWSAAVRESGVPACTSHVLRHTTASLAIQAGADVKVLQQMLGHASAAMTLDRYGHLFDRKLDDVSGRIAGLLGPP